MNRIAQFMHVSLERFRADWEDALPGTPLPEKSACRSAPHGWDGSCPRPMAGTTPRSQFRRLQGDNKIQVRINLRLRRSGRLVPLRGHEPSLRND